MIFFILLFYWDTNSQQLDKTDLTINKCGLNYFFKTEKIASRTNGILPLPVTTPPIKFNITELQIGDCYKIEKAIVTWTVSYRINSPIVPSVSIIDPKGNSFKTEAQFTGEDQKKAWAEIGTRSFMADVTDFISINGDYSISVSTNDWETDGICLFVIYSDLKANYEGHLAINYGLATNPFSFFKNLSGLDVCETDNNAKAFMLISDLQPYKSGAGNWEDDVRIRLNNTDVMMKRTFFSMYEITTTLNQGQTNSEFGLQSKYVNYPSTSDFFSVAMIGAYYQSKNCNECPMRIQNEISSNIANDTACKGAIVDLFANSNADSVYWTNYPKGYISSEKTIQITLDSNQKYIFHSMLGNGCITKSDTISLIAINPPVLAFDTIALVCGGTPTQIGGLATGFGAPFTYNWTPSTGLSDPTIANPFVTTNNETEFLLTVTDRFGCITLRNVKVLMSQGAEISLTSDTAICSGTLIDLNPIISGGNLPYNIQWSPPEYFTNISLQNQSIIADSSIICKITVTDSKGCVTESEISIIVPETIIISLIDSVSVCFGDSISINANIISAKKPVEFKWDFDNQTNFPDDSTLIFLPLYSDYLYLSVTDSVGCVRTDSIFIQVNPLPEPIISGNRTIPLCTCDSVTLSLDSQYSSIIWSTGDTTSSITVKDAGIYTVSVSDSNGCNNSSLPFAIDKIDPFTRISFDKKIYYSKNAEIITIYIKIDSSTFLDYCFFDSFHTNIKLNKSLLVPLEIAESGIIAGKDRLITIEKKFNGTQNYLDSLTFIATLGDADSTLIEFENFYWTNCDYKNETVNSVYIPTDICRADSISRFYLSGENIEPITLYPNPANSLINLEYFSAENGNFTLDIIDLCGKQLFSNDLILSANRKFAILIDTHNFETGIYFIKISNDYNIYTKKMIINR